MPRCFEIRSLRYASNDFPIWDRVSFTDHSRNPQELLRLDCPGKQ
jgi:hypothetical protein